MFWLVIGYLFLFIFRPYEYWSVLGTFHVERIYMVVLIGMVLLNGQKKYVPHPVNRAVMAFFCVAAVSAIFAFNTGDAFNAVYEYVKLLIFYFIVILTIRDEKDIKNFIIAYIVIMFLYVGKSAWEFFVHDRYLWRMGVKRMQGIDSTYGDPNYFAASIVYSLPFWWALLKSGTTSLRDRLFYWAYGALALIAIVYSGSRAGLVTLIVFGICVWLASSRKMIGVMLLAVVVAGGWMAMPESYKIRLMSSFSEERAEDAGQKGAAVSAHGRIVGLQTGYETFLRHPLLGIGPGNFKYAFLAGTREQFGMSAHNLYGQLLGEVGGLGFVAFAVFIWVTMRTHARLAKKAKLLLSDQNRQDVLDSDRQQIVFMRLMAIASMQAMVLLLFNGNFGHNLYRYNYLWIAALGVLGTSVIRSKEKETGEALTPSISHPTIPHKL